MTIFIESLNELIMILHCSNFASHLKPTTGCALLWNMSMVARYAVLEYPYSLHSYSTRMRIVDQIRCAFDLKLRIGGSTLIMPFLMVEYERSSERNLQR